jgi:NodT family efflux transporter outer membrane factor (OMF) lipoprotein
MGRFKWERLVRDSVRTRDPGQLPRTRGPTGGRAFALVALLLALGGCTVVGPQFVKPEVAVNPGWTAKEEAKLDTAKAADAAWWRTFNDPILDQLIAQAWQQNLTVRAAGLRIAEARAQLALAVGQKWPQVQAAFGQASAVGISGSSANTANLDRHYGEFQAGFDAAWEIDFWGRYQNLQRSEAARYFSTVADYDSALVTLSAEVARTYALIRTYETLAALAEKNVKVQQEGYRIAEARFRYGATSELDVTQAKTLLESTRVSIPRYQLSLRQAQNALSTLLGQPTGKVQALLGPPRGIPVAPPTAAVGMPAELLRRRPDIRSAEFAALEQSARVGVATADLYPRISLTGTVGLLTTGGGLDLNSGFYALGLRFWLPVFDYDRTKNNIRVEDARLQQLLVNYESVVLRAQQEAEDGVVGFVRSYQIAAFAQNAATSAQRSSDLAFIQYREGAVDFQRVIDAMRALLQEETTLAQAQSDIATNLISLYKALGGGWELHQDQPVIPERTRTEMENRTNWGDLLSKPPAPETLNTQTAR